MQTQWKLLELKRKPDTGGVFEVVATLSGTIDDEDTRRIEVIKFEPDSTAPDFIDFEQLTEETVLSWIENTLGKEKIDQLIEEMQQELDRKIQQKQNPEFLTGMPWEQE